MALFLAAAVAVALAAAGAAIAAPGDITTVAGNDPFAYEGGVGDGGPATSASLVSPWGVALAGGKLFLSQNGYNSDQSRVRVVGAGGDIATYAGGVDPPLNDGAPATEAALAFPGDIASDKDGNRYIADTGHQRVRKVDVGTGIITTVAGSTVCLTVDFCSGGYSGDGGQATAAELNYPTSVAIDGDGNIYVSTVGDYDPNTFLNFNRVRRIDASTGVITTVAGGGSPADGVGDGGPATDALLSYPRGIDVDAAGNLYIADLYQHRIRKVDASTGKISTVAGTGEGGLSGDGGPATSAQLLYPSGVAVNSSGDLFIADEGNNRVRKVDASSGTITTVAGTSTGGYSGDGGPATSAQLNVPIGVSIDGAGSLFISDAGNVRVRKVDSSGTITTFAGNGEYGYSGDGGPATEAGVYAEGTDADGGSLFIADSQSSRIRKVDAGGTITTVAGGGIGDGFPATKAALSQPRGLARDGSGDLLIADCGNKRVRKVDAPSKVISTVAGTVSPRGLGDGGQATKAALECPSGLAVAGGSLYIADADVNAGRGVASSGTTSNRIRKVDSSGTITTVAGTGSSGFGGDGGPATAAKLSSPSGVALDGAGNLYIADTANNRVRKVDTAGKISTVAGNGDSGVGIDAVLATKTPVTSPTGVAFDPAGNLIIAESGFARIRKVNGSGIISTIAGNGIPGFSGDGGPATSATLDLPTQLAYDSGGNLLFSDRENGRIRRIEAGTPPPPPVATRKTADCGKTIVKNVTLSQDIGPCPGAGLVIGADGVKLNLGGHKIIGDSGRSGTDVGVRLTGRKKVTVTKGTITGFDAGVAIVGGSGNTVSKLTVANNLGGADSFSSTFGDGIVVFFSPGNSILDNSVIDNGLFDGIGLLGVGSDGNLIQGNRVKGTTNDGQEFGPVGIGIISNPFLGNDRPRNLSLIGNRIIGNRVQANGNGGISNLSNVDGVVQDNRVEQNGFQSEFGQAFPGNGIGVQNLAFAEPQTRMLVKSNRVLGNANDGIQVVSKSNRILSNTADGNGGEGAGIYSFDFHDYNNDPDTYEPNCDSNVWSANIWGSGGFFPDCASAGGRLLGGNGAKASLKLRPPPEAARRPADPPVRRKFPAKP